MAIIQLVLLVICCVIGMVAVVFTTVGTLIILLGIFVYTLITGFGVITPQLFLLLIFLYFVGEGLEYIFLIIGGRKFGATNAALVGSVIGACVGALVGSTLLGIGVFLGTLLGIFLGAVIPELLLRRGISQSLKSGTGSVLGRFGAIAEKGVIAMVMSGIAITKAVGHVIKQ